MRFAHAFVYTAHCVTRRGTPPLVIGYMARGEVIENRVWLRKFNKFFFFFFFKMMDAIVEPRRDCDCIVGTVWLDVARYNYIFFALFTVVCIGILLWKCSLLVASLSPLSIPSTITHGTRSTISSCILLSLSLIMLQSQCLS